MLKELESRVAELRGSNIDKEVEIVLEEGGKKREHFPYSENVTAWNLAAHDEQKLIKKLIEHN